MFSKMGLLHAEEEYMWNNPDIYVPGSWICTYCNKRFSDNKQVLVRHSLITLCPVDERPMRRETYREALVTLTEAASEMFAAKHRLAKALAVAIDRFHTASFEKTPSNPRYLKTRNLALKALRESGYSSIEELLEEANVTE